MITGIYCIENISSGKKYIGSSIDVVARVTAHYGKLDAGTHVNTELQNDWTRLGKSDFKWFLIEETDEKSLLRKEYDVIGKTKLTYNVSKRFKPIPDLTDDDKEKFFSSYVKVDDCWIWASDSSNTYPRFYIPSIKERFQAHRVSFKLHFGEYDIYSIVCHTCDNKKCVNPEHLFLGSVSDNMTDRTKKGLGCKLSQEMAELIRKIYQETPSKNSKHIQEILSKDYNIQVTRVTINSVLRNQSYYDESFTGRDKFILSGEEASWSKLNWEIVNFIRSEYNSGSRIASIAEKVYKIYRTTVHKQQLHQIAVNKRWKDDNYFPRRRYKK